MSPDLTVRKPESGGLVVLAPDWESRLVGIVGTEGLEMPAHGAMERVVAHVLTDGHSFPVGAKSTESADEFSSQRGHLCSMPNRLNRRIHAGEKFSGVPQLHVAFLSR